MMSLQEMSDRLEIQDLFARYCFAIDERDWEALDGLFTSDATIDYSAAGGPVGSVAEIKRWLPGAMARFPVCQHLAATTKLKLEGDTASSRTILFNPMVYEDGEGIRQSFFLGLWYRDQLVRTPDGWRISDRREEFGWDYNTPAMEAVPELHC